MKVFKCSPVIDTEKVCKRHDEARRTLAKRVRELSRSESVASLSEVPTDAVKTTEASPKNTPIVGKQMPFVLVYKCLITQLLALELLVSDANPKYIMLVLTLVISFSITLLMNSANLDSEPAF